MLIKLKEGDSFIEVDTEFTDDMIDTLENETLNKSNNLEDTIEIKPIVEDNDETREN